MGFNNLGLGKYGTSMIVLDKKDNWFHLNLGSWVKILQYVMIQSLIVLRLNNKDALTPAVYTLLPKTNVVWICVFELG